MFIIISRHPLLFPDSDLSSSQEEVFFHYTREIHIRKSVRSNCDFLMGSLACVYRNGYGSSPATLCSLSGFAHNIFTATVSGWPSQIHSLCRYVIHISAGQLHFYKPVTKLLKSSFCNSGRIRENSSLLFPNHTERREEETTCFWSVFL